MCGRFVLFSGIDAVSGLLGADPYGVGLAPSYNIAPTRPVVAAVRADDGTRRLAVLRWGLVPSWSKGPDSRFAMINARCETAAERPAYRAAWRRRRCLVPMDGFYEWERRPDGGKQPWFLRLAGGGVFAVAGLWEHWTAPGGEEIHSCTLLTTAANRAVAPVHDRMPVIVPPERFDAWMDPESPAAELEALCRPLPEAQVELWPVGSRVNSARHDGADLIGRDAEQPRSATETGRGGP